MKRERTFSTWIDISIPLQEGMAHWPTDPSFEKAMVQEIDKGDSANLSNLRMGAHTGTHVDAPLHFIKNGTDVATIPVDTMIGPARVIEILDRSQITAEELIPHKVRRNERLLFKTANSSGIWASGRFVPNFVALTANAADYLVQMKIKMIGIDYLSVGPYHGNGKDIHRQLLSHNIGIIEGLDLSRVKAGKYFLICLPLKIKSGDGAPARAVLKPVR